MAKFKLKGKIETLKGFEEKLQAKLFSDRTAQNAFKAKIFPVVAEAFNDAIEAERHHFQPFKTGGDDLVGALGVGSGGNPDKEKLNDAWKLLQVIGVAESISSLKLSLAKGSKFATFDFEINKEAFYNHFRTTYVSHSKHLSTLVKWMENYLRGIPKIQDYGFVTPDEPRFKEASSRTGLGHMVKVRIPSRQFSLPGYGENRAFGAVISSIKNKLTSTEFTTEMSKKIAQALRSRKKNA